MVNHLYHYISIAAIEFQMLCYSNIYKKTSYWKFCWAAKALYWFFKSSYATQLQLRVLKWSNRSIEQMFFHSIVWKSHYLRNSTRKLITMLRYSFLGSSVVKFQTSFLNRFKVEPVRQTGSVLNRFESELIRKNRSALTRNKI